MKGQIIVEQCTAWRQVDRLRHDTRFSVGFTRISHYVNDDKTRSFVGFDIGFGHEEVRPKQQFPSFIECELKRVGLLPQLASCLKDVDDVIGQFRKDPFYEVHASQHILTMLFINLPIGRLHLSTHQQHGHQGRRQIIQSLEHYRALKASYAVFDSQ